MHGPVDRMYRPDQAGRPDVLVDRPVDRIDLDVNLHRGDPIEIKKMKNFKNSKKQAFFVCCGWGMLGNHPHCVFHEKKNRNLDFRIFFRF